jgi:hypothetical protein
MRPAKPERLPPGKAWNSSRNGGSEREGVADAAQLAGSAADGFWKRARIGQGRAHATQGFAHAGGGARVTPYTSADGGLDDADQAEVGRRFGQPESEQARPPAFSVRSIVSSKEPSRAPPEAAKSSRLREEAASRSTASPSFASIRRNRFFGRSQSESVT